MKLKILICLLVLNINMYKLINASDKNAEKIATFCALLNLLPRENESEYFKNNFVGKVLDCSFTKKTYMYFHTRDENTLSTLTIPVNNEQYSFHITQYNQYIFFAMFSLYKLSTSFIIYKALKTFLS